MKLNFSIRQMLIGMIGVGVLVAVVAAAFGGSIIAYGVLMGCLLMVIPIFGLAVMYLVARIAFEITTVFRPVGQGGKHSVPAVSPSPAPPRSSDVNQTKAIE